MKKIILGLAVLGALVSMVSVQEVRAQACGGTVQPEPDCNNTRRPWNYVCCPSGYRVQGIAYNDVRKQDHVDAVSTVCRSIAKGNDMMPNDFSKQPVTFVCDKQEVMAGIEFKDVRVQGGDDRDTLDGVTAVCQNPSSKALRTIYNADIGNNPRGAVQNTVLLPRRVVGIAYKERDDGGDQPGSSDRTDCVTIITK